MHGCVAVLYCMTLQAIHAGHSCWLLMYLQRQATSLSVCNAVDWVLVCQDLQVARMQPDSKLLLLGLPHPLAGSQAAVTALVSENSLTLA